MNEYSLEAALYLHDVMMVTEIIALIIGNINSYTSRHGNNITSGTSERGLFTLVLLSLFGCFWLNTKIIPFMLLYGR